MQNVVLLGEAQSPDAHLDSQFRRLTRARILITFASVVLCARALHLQWLLLAYQRLKSLVATHHRPAFIRKFVLRWSGQSHL